MLSDTCHLSVPKTRNPVQKQLTALSIYTRAKNTVWRAANYESFKITVQISKLKTVELSGTNKRRPLAETNF